jgi:MFS family permease
LYYAAGIFKAAGIESYAAVLTGAFKLVMTLLSVVVVDKYGRRWLLFVGISIMLAALIVLTSAFHGYEPVNDDDDDSVDGSGFTPRTLAIVLGMFLFIGGYQVSFGPIAWLLISEVFALDVRDSAIAVAVQANFFWNLVVSFGYPTLVAGMKAMSCVGIVCGARMVVW